MTPNRTSLSVTPGPGATSATVDEGLDELGVPGDVVGDVASAAVVSDASSTEADVVTTGDALVAVVLSGSSLPQAAANNASAPASATAARRRVLSVLCDMVVRSPEVNRYIGKWRVIECRG